MDNESRTKKSIKNAYYSLFNQVVAIVLQFALRTVFIKTLAAEYLGVNGLFSDILSVLSLTELGLGTALITSMYKPIARGDKEEILKYFFAYRKVYTSIGSIIAVIGLCLTPFLNYLIADSGNIPHLRLLFLLYLSDTVASYFFAQYRALFSANQKEYVNANNRTIFLIIQSIVQVAILFIFHSFIIYMLVKIACNVLSGYSLSLKAKKQFPYIRTQTNERLANNEKKTVLNDSIGVLSTKIELTVLNSTDSILVSSVLGSIVTGLYSNYRLIISTVSTAIGLVFAGLQASIGNYCAQKTEKEANLLFDRIGYIYFCFYGFSTICFIGLLSPTITIWVGESFLLNLGIVWIVSFNFYLSNARQAILQFITIYHLLPKLNIKNIIEALVNIAISVVLVNLIGLPGIFIGTAMSLLSCSVWYEPLVLYKNIWKKSVWKYYVLFLIRIVVVGLASLASCAIVMNVFNGDIISFIICIPVTIVVALASVTIPFAFTDGFKYMTTSVKRIVFAQKKREQNAE